MPGPILCAFACISYIAAADPSASAFIWPAVVLVVVLLIVFSPWGRSIVKISTKFGELQRQVADTVDKTERHGEQLATQQQQIEDQQRKLQDLVRDVARYSISDYIFYLLFNLDIAQKTNGEYLYRRDGTMWRNLRFLMDHGYVEEIYPEPDDWANLKNVVRITPAGHALINLRAQVQVPAA
jgi:hypothetical protein